MPLNIELDFARFHLTGRNRDGQATDAVPVWINGRQHYLSAYRVGQRRIHVGGFCWPHSGGSPLVSPVELVVFDNGNHFFRRADMPDDKDIPVESTHIALSPRLFDRLLRKDKYKSV